MTAQSTKALFRATKAKPRPDHRQRHTFATRLLRHTGNLKLVSRLLGHTQVETTMRYAHVLDEDMRAGLEGYAVTGRVPKKSPKRAKS